MCIGGIFCVLCTINIYIVYTYKQTTYGMNLMPHVLCILYSNCTCTHRGLKVRGIVPNHRKSPVCPNCFLFVSRDHQRSFLEDLAKCRADLRFSSHWWCSASNSVKRRQHAIIQNIDGKLNLRLTASLALGRGPLVSRQPQWASNSCHI